MSVSYVGLSGEGHSPLDASFAVAAQFIDVRVTTIPTRARKIGNSTLPLAVWNIGQFGLGWFTDDPSANPTDQLALTTFIHQAQETIIVSSSQGGSVFFGSFWWRLAAGVVIDVDVSW